MLRAGIRDIWRAYRAQWWRIAIVQSLAILGVSVVITLGALVAQVNFAAVMKYLAEDPSQLDSRAGSVVWALITAITLVTIPFFVASAAATVQVTDAALESRPGRLWRAFRLSFARVLPITATLAVAFLLVVVSFVSFPFISLVGLIGLIVTGVISLIRRVKPAVLPRWLDWRAWAFTTIPFAWFFRLSATAMLMLPAAVLEPAGPLRAYRTAAPLTVARRWKILVIMALASLVAFGLSTGATVLGSTLWGDAGAAILGSIVQFIALPLPVVAAVALYRRVAGPSSRVVGPAASPAPSREGAYSAMMSRMAITLVAALLLSAGLVSVPGAADSASAEPAHAGVDVSYSVTSGKDTVDPDQLSLQAASCSEAGPDCTIRAALLSAAGDTRDGALSVTIGFSKDLTIPVADTLQFQGDGSQSGTLFITANGHHVVLDGGHSAQILHTQSESWQLSITGLTFKNGSAQSGGGLQSGQSLTTLQSVLFEDNIAQSSGGAVAAQRLIVRDSSFVNNHAVADGAVGGALSAAGNTSIVNSTFYGSQLGGGENPIYSDGSDVTVGYGVLTVVNSTFVDFRGGSLESVNGGDVRNSLFISAGGGAFACVNTFTGGSNIHNLGDASCPGTGTPVATPIEPNLDYSGMVPVFRLKPTGGPAIGSGTDCPTHDALGAARSATGCDLGAVELPSRPTTISVTTVPDPDVVGTVTLTATVTPDSGAAPEGSVIFTMNTVVHDPVTLTAVGDGTSTASIVISGLTLSETYSYSAGFVTYGPWDSSNSGSSAYTVGPIPVVVDLACTNFHDPSSTAAPECTGPIWKITDSGSISLTATVRGDDAGSVVIALDTQGTTVIAGPKAVADGAVTFDLPASAFGLGLFPTLHAIYTSSDGQHAGVSATARQLQVLRTPTVTLRGLPASGAYGNPATGTVTVTVAGASATPSGTVTILGRVATLDAFGRATIDVSTLPVLGGVFQIGAQYSGDGVYGRGASSQVSYYTTPAHTSTSISTLTPAAPQFGAPLTVTVTVRALDSSSADPQGTVTLIADGTTTFGPLSFDPTAKDSDGKTTFEVIIPAGSLRAGGHELQAEFVGSGNFIDSELAATDAIQVAKAPTSTTLHASPTSSVFGDQVTVTATVDATGIAALPTGDVDFIAGTTFLGTATLAACPTPNAEGCSVATLTFAASSIGVGTAVLTAHYTGVANFAESSDTDASYVVAKASPTVSVQGNATQIYGHASTYSVSVGTTLAKPVDSSSVVLVAQPTTGSAIALGTVSLLNGSGTINIPLSLVPGSYTITATFAGDAQFFSASESAQLTVIAATTAITLDSTSGTTVTYGGTLDVGLTVKNTSGTPAPEGQVVVTWAGWEVGRVTLSAADDNGAGVRTVQVPALFGLNIPMQSASWLTAEYVPAAGFAASHLSSAAPNDRISVTLRPLTTAVTLDSSAVLGLPLQATATVKTEGSLGVVPGGAVTFLITTGGGGTINVGPVNLINGKLTLDQALGMQPAIIVSGAGTWSVRATYAKDLDNRYSSASPDNTAINYMDVQAGNVRVTTQAPTTAGLGSPITVHVTVAGATTLTGKARIQLSSGNVGVSDEITLVNGQADVPIYQAWLTIGSREYVAYYVGNGNYSSTTSAPFTILVGTTSTTTTLTTSSQVRMLYPGMLGATVHYSAHVAAAAGTVAGTVTFYRDAIQIGSGNVDATGNVTISKLVDAVWSGIITATFVPYSASVAQSSATLTHSWIQPPVSVTVFGPTTARIGSAANYTAQVSFNLYGYAQLPTDQLPPHAPAGSVTITDAAGATCTAALTEVGTSWALGDCSLLFTALGTKSVRATFAGDPAAWASGVSDATDVVVGRGTAALILSTPNGASWPGLTSIPVTWQVQGPASGSVTIKRGDDVVCTSTSLSGGCEVSIPAWDRAANGNVLTLSFGGNTLWKDGSTTASGTIDACVPFQTSTVSPSGTATLSIQPAPTCGTGTGYYLTDWVHVEAQSAVGHIVTGFSGGLVTGYPRLAYPTSDITFEPIGGNANLSVYPTLRFLDGVVIPFGIQADTSALCVPVQFTTTGISDPTIMRNLILRDSSSDGCPSGVVGSGSTYTASVRFGTKVNVSIQSGSIPSGRKFYGWRNLQAGDPYATSATYTIDSDHYEITANFGNICYSNAPIVAQPTDGTITVALSAPNCSDPSTGTTGWVRGTPGSATLVDSTGSSVQVVSTTYGSLNGTYQAINTTGWVPSKPVYFDSWQGDTGLFTVGADTTNTDATGVRRSSRSISFALGTTPFHIGASYLGCAVLTSAVGGDATNGSPGTVTMNTPGNCPISAGAGAARWYKTGTSVSVTALAAGGTLKLMGWNGLALPTANIADKTVTFVITSDVTATALFGSNVNCRPISITAIPSALISLTTTYALGANVCEPLYGPKFYDQGASGNSIDVDVNQSGAAVGSQTVFQWSTNLPGSASGTNDGISDIWSRSASLQQPIYGNTTVIAYACEFVKIGAAVHDPNGQIVDGTEPGSGAANTDPATQDQLKNYLITQPADCAIGADPNSHYGGYAWLVGTQLKPISVADPAAYRFTGWSGDVAGTGTSPDSGLTLAGAGHSASGDSYNFHVTANYVAICHELIMPTSTRTEVLTAPNCPYTEAGRALYLGGTPVILHATDVKGFVFQGWNGVDAIDSDPHWASLIMGADKSVSASYRETNAGEDVTAVATKVGDNLAIGSKKMIGVASGIAAAYAKDILSKVTLAADAIGYIGLGLEAVGVHGDAIDGMKSMSTMMNNVIGLLWAPMDCITAWSAGGEDTAFYAAQNAIGNVVVAYMSLNAKKIEEQVARPVSTWDKLTAAAAEIAAKIDKKTEKKVAAAAALAQAKKVYVASSSGIDGWEASAYDAWGSRASVSVYTTCMANRVSKAGDSVSAAAP